MEVIHLQPEDAGYDDILRELAFECMIERGLENTRNGCVISKKS